MNFDCASLNLSDYQHDGKLESAVVPELKESDPRFVLYKGGCSCNVPSKKTVNLVVLGQTGSGKTTLLDSFLNHVMGVDFYDKFRYKLVDES